MSINPLPLILMRMPEVIAAVILTMPCLEVSIELILERVLIFHEAGSVAGAFCPE
jgi:hypothetical protein